MAGRAMEMKVYVYEEYNEILPYGEEIIEVYKDRDMARKRLSERVTKHFNKTWTELNEDLGLDEIMEPDYVQIYEDNNLSYWCILEKNVLANVEGLTNDQKRSRDVSPTNVCKAK